MKFSIITLTLLILLTGCFASGPAVIKNDDPRLGKKSNSEQQQIEKLEKQIIAVQDEKKSIEKKYIITKQKIRVHEYEIAKFGSIKRLLLEKRKLYSLQKESSKVNKIGSDLQKNNNIIKYKNLEIRLQEAIKDDFYALGKLKKAELSSKIAELNLLKAKIVRKNEERLHGKDKKKQAKFIKVSEYENYFKSQKKEVKLKKKDRIRTQTLIKNAQLKLKNAAHLLPKGTKKKTTDTSDKTKEKSE